MWVLSKNNMHSIPNDNKLAEKFFSSTWNCVLVVYWFKHLLYYITQIKILYYGHSNSFCQINENVGKTGVADAVLMAFPAAWSPLLRGR